MSLVRENWRHKVLTMADLEQALCMVQIRYHVEDKRFDFLRDVLEQVGGAAEYFAKEPEKKHVP